jgi:hypothetical protein
LGGLGDAEVAGLGALLGYEGVDDLRCELGGVVAPVAVLPQDGNHDIRVAARGHAYEPGVGQGVVALVGAGERVVADDLRGAGLAGEVDPFKMRRGGGTGGTKHGGHAVGDGLPVGGGERDRLLAGTGVGLLNGPLVLRRDLRREDKVRAVEDATGGDAPDSAGQLNGRRGDGSLPDADRDDFAGVPFFMLGLQLPGRGGHGAGDFIGQVDAGLLRQAKRRCVARDGVDTEVVGEGVVEGVAGERNGVVDVDCAVVLVAGEEMSVEAGAAVALNVQVLGDVLLQARHRHDDLEGAAGCELRLDGLVEQRVVRVIQDRRPVAVGEPDGELVGVEAGARDHGKDLAGVRVQRDDGSGLSFEGLFGRLLDVEVDGELEILSGLGEFLAEVSDLLAVRVDDYVARAVHAAQERVVGGFDAGAADDVAGRVGGVAVVVGEHLLGDLADVADEVSGETVARVEAALLDLSFQLGQLVAVRFDEGLLVLGNVLLEGQRLELGGGGETLERGLNLLQRNVQAGGDQGEFGVGILDLFAQQITVRRRIVIDDQATFAVEDAASGSEDGNLADSVGLGQRAIAVHTEDLEIPEAEQKRGQDGDDDVLRGVQFAGRYLFFSVQRGIRGDHHGRQCPASILFPPLQAVEQQEEWDGDGGVDSGAG